MQLENPNMEQFSQHFKYTNTSKGKSKVVPVHAMKVYCGEWRYSSTH